MQPFQAQHEVAQGRRVGFLGQQVGGEGNAAAPGLGGGHGFVHEGL